MGEKKLSDFFMVIKKRGEEDWNANYVMWFYIKGADVKLLI